jgi:hypothetical protein
MDRKLDISIRKVIGDEFVAAISNADLARDWACNSRSKLRRSSP